MGNKYQFFIYKTLFILSKNKFKSASSLLCYDWQGIMACEFRIWKWLIPIKKKKKKEMAKLTSITYYSPVPS